MKWKRQHPGQIVKKLRDADATLAPRDSDMRMHAHQMKTKRLLPGQRHGNMNLSLGKCDLRMCIALN